jgi:uncharacterized protein YbaR (Trm112 family)
MSLKLNNDILSCPICNEISQELLICKICLSTICKKCVNDIINSSSELKQLKCPMCAKELDNFIENKNLNIILEDLIFKCEKCNEYFPITEQDIYDEHIQNCEKDYCKLCNKSFKSKKSFYFHLYEDLHRRLIVLNFNKKEMKLGMNNLISILRNKKNFDDKNKDDNQTINLLKLIENIYINKVKNNILKINYIKYDNDKINKIRSYFDNIQIINKKMDVNEFIKLNNKENKSIFFDENFEFFYCLSELNCSCCQGKKCENNHCFCLNCMELNKKFYGLNDNELINKYGRVCDLKFIQFGVGYYCNCVFIKEYKNLNEFKFKKKFKCNFDDDLCKACKELNNNLNIYIEDKYIKQLNKNYLT